MKSLSGGAADKAGNEYEHLWTAHVFAELLSGKASRIRLEPPGDHGEGIEFEVDRDGVTWGDQVKLRTGNWTINRLEHEGVLAAAIAQIRAGRHFNLVVSTEAMPLDTFARRSAQRFSLDEFSSTLSSADSADFSKLTEIWRVGPDEAFDLLRSIRVLQYPYENLRQFVLTEFRFLFSEDPATVLAELRSFCDAHVHEHLRANEVWSFFESKGFRRRRFGGDDIAIANLRETVERHRRWVDAVRPSIGLVPSKTLGRLRDLVKADDGKQIVVLEGNAGYGKSTIVAELAHELQAAGWVVAVANMRSVNGSVTTCTGLGERSGLGANSPSVMLAGVADGGPGLLVVDQLDAVGAYSGRSTEAWDAVADLLSEVAPLPNVKVLVVVRAIDLEADPRFAALRDPTRAERLRAEKLDVEDVQSTLSARGVPIPVSDVTTELLRTPLHLSIYLRLSEAARSEDYPTLQRLYDRYTEEVRMSVESAVGHLHWSEITGALVERMNQTERLAAPFSVLDPFSREEVHALESVDVLSRGDQDDVAFFHESYFDYLFARSFLASAQRLLDFVLASGQQLFRRAQVRQVLEHLAGTDKASFRNDVRDLLASELVRSHIKDVVLDVFEQVEAETEDWLGLDAIAWSDSRFAWRVRNLLARPSWFAAADHLEKWPRWLADPSTADRAFRQLLPVARVLPARVTELLRPFVGAGDEWRSRLKSFVEWALTPESTDLAIELLSRGELDDARGPIAVNTDFWSIIFALAQQDSAAAARLIGAFLNRGLERARSEGSDDPFETGQLAVQSVSDQVLASVATESPEEFLAQVVPFVEAVAQANQRQVWSDRLPVGNRWGFRTYGAAFTVDDRIFEGVSAALTCLAASNPALCDRYIAELGGIESEELHFLAGRALVERGPADRAVEWLVADLRNLELGYGGEPGFVSRELIKGWSGECSHALFTTLESVILTHLPEWEGKDRRGAAQLRLLSALAPSRLSEAGRRRLLELKRRFPEAEPDRRPQGISGGIVGSPVPYAAGQKMSDGDWLGALVKYNKDSTEWRDEKLVGGAHELAQMLAKYAEAEPERFARLALRFGPEMNAAAADSVIRSVAQDVADDLLCDLCEHAQRMFGSSVGQAICDAAEQKDPLPRRLAEIVALYVDDPNPDREWAMTDAGSGKTYFNGDLEMAGLNSTRGQVARVAAIALRQSPELIEVLEPVVSALANDPNLGVRTLTAEAILALMTYDPERAYELSEELLDADIAFFGTRQVEKLLTYLLLRAPDRFAADLSRTLAGPPFVSERAGHMWALLLTRGSLPAGVARDINELEVAARRGAAEGLAQNASEASDALSEFFDDEDDEVRSRAASVMRYLATLDASTSERLVQRFLPSRAFADHFDELIRELANLDALPSELVLQSCERSVAVAMGDLGDIRTSRSILAQPIMVSVLRVYRRGDAAQRERCLDLIDRLTEINAIGFSEVLKDER